VANEQRAVRDYTAGTLSTAAAISDTALVADIFANLPTTYSTTQYLPLVIHDPSTNVYEVVWVTAHASTSTTVTVVRAREGTTARAWPTGSYVICSPTVRDALMTSTLAGLPTDAHTGMRAMITDKGDVRQRVNSGAWVAAVGVGLADDIGPYGGGSFPPSSAAIVVRAAHVTGSTDSSGQIAVTYRTPFPTATIAVVISGRSPSVPLYSADNPTVNGFTCGVWKVTQISPTFITAAMNAGFAASFDYVAVGF
jgi:hypothetical protein